MLHAIHAIHTSFVHATHALHAIFGSFSQTIRADLPEALLGLGLALGLIGTFALFLDVKREMRIHMAKNQTRMEALAQELDRAQRDPEPELLPAASRSGLGHAQLNVSQLNVSPVNVAQTTVFPMNVSGMNSGKRVQAMRMVRRNQDVSHIAAALGVTRSEVELLIRVQRIGASAVRTAAN